MRDQALIDFVDLAVAYLDGRATESQVTDLCAQLEADPAKRDLFVDLSMTPELIREAHEAKSPREVVPTATPKPLAAAQRGPGISRSPRPTPFIIYPIAIAAALLLTAAIVVVYLIAFTTDPQPDPVKPDRPAAPGPAVATLIEVSGGGDLRTPHGYPAEGDDYGRGEYALTTGTAEFMLTNSVNVQLRGETRMRMQNDMNVTLNRGRAAFVVPPAATGFTVHLPGGAKIVDLGTSFIVRVNGPTARDVDVYVVEGEVRIELPDGHVQPVAAGDAYAINARNELAGLGPDQIKQAFAVADNTEGLLAHWALDGSDESFGSGSRNEGVVFDVEGPRPNTRAARFTEGATIDLDKRPDLLIDHPMTFETWVWIDAHGREFQRFFSVGGTADGGGWGLGIVVADGIVFPRFTHYHVHDYDFEQIKLAPQRWHYLVVTVDAKRVSLYHNGRPAGRLTREGALISGRISAASLGRMSALNELFNGRLSQVSIFNRVLSDDEIAARHEARSNPEPHHE